MQPRWLLELLLVGITIGSNDRKLFHGSDKSRQSQDIFSTLPFHRNEVQGRIQGVDQGDWSPPKKNLISKAFMRTNFLS